MGEMSDRFDVDIFAYVLMNNHYHILFRTNKPNLSKAMQWLGVTYTRRFNNRHARSGHLFQGRFKSLIVENDTYLVRLSCYIHRNPLRARIVKRLIELLSALENRDRSAVLAVLDAAHQGIFAVEEN